MPMEQNVRQLGEDEIPAWALSLIAVVIILVVVILLAWFTTGPGKGLSRPAEFSPTPATATPTSRQGSDLVVTAL
jgi:hypothetical protein